MRIKVLFIFTSVAITSVITNTPGFPNPYWDIPGDYCKARYPGGGETCCDGRYGRHDPCSVPILGTLCYCDKFCNQIENSDCCPDFFTYCLGLSWDNKSTIEPPSTLTRTETPRK